jgi:4-hydroxy-tetrahydrodipicolinate reductase
MNIALIGYGKMGKTIEALGKAQGHHFPLIVDEENPEDFNAENLQSIEVAIEFTAPGAAPKNILACINQGIPVVSGTTGWNDRFDEIVAYCLKNEGTLFYASNYSIGVNILFAMNQKLARIMNQFPAYQVSMEEVHHVHKLDEPSGTAISLAEQIISETDRLTGWELSGSDAADSLNINAIREGEVKGIHQVKYESEVDYLSLGHHAKSRDAFAAGVLMAAQFIGNKKGVFGMEDLLKL